VLSKTNKYVHQLVNINIYIKMHGATIITCEFVKVGKVLYPLPFGASRSILHCYVIKY